MSCDLRRSIANVNLRLFAALLFMGLVPTLYTTFRVFLVGQLPGEWSYSIAGQLTWVNLLYEIMDEAIILPLFFCLGSPKNDQEGFSNRIKTGMAAAGIIYTAFAFFIIIFAKPMLAAMAADKAILSESAVYIRIESIANIFGILYRFLCVAIIAAGREKSVYIITGAKLVLCLLFDACLVSTLSLSANLGVNGIGYSNILVNAILTVIAWTMLQKNGYIQKKKLSFKWLKGFLKIGGISGLESLIRNTAYILMVSRMVNMVGEQGTYWVANNFIWGWMLLPVLQLGELIKQETAEKETNIERNTPAYFAITFIIIIIWILTIPLYKPFMGEVLGFQDVNKLFRLIMILFVPYAAFAFQNIFDATFYGRGKTNYMLFEAILTNSIYYGAAFVLYQLGIWKPSLFSIAVLFGVGNIFDSLVSGVIYRYFRKSRFAQARGLKDQSGAWKK